MLYVRLSVMSAQQGLKFSAWKCNPICYRPDYFYRGVPVRWKRAIEGRDNTLSLLERASARFRPCQHRRDVVPATRFKS
jgi:hypothetical protein